MPGEKDHIAEAMIRPDSVSGAVLLLLKAVPGASRDQIAGVLGERLKVRVAAPPEDGKANAAICRLLTGALGVPSRSVTIVAGQTRAEKTARVDGLSAAQVAARLGV
jgi:uncharacterized protein (TIGR00251 family)